MNTGCLHGCHVCETLFTHEPHCEQILDVPICSSCQHDGWEAGYCPKCEDTQPILKGHHVCDGCLTTKMRIA
jgi:hypothetical protein